MRYFRLLGLFVSASMQEELAYRANFWIHLLHSLLNLATGLAGVCILFKQVDNLQGWNYPSALGVLGIYLVVSAFRSLVIGPSLDALAGMNGDIWKGNFDFTLLRPINLQFIVSLRKWNLFALFDLLLGIGVLALAMAQPGQLFTLLNLAGFFVALLAGMAVIYAMLLVFSALVFWSPGFLFTWVFDALFQLGRYPVEIYPNWIRLVLTWIIPLGVVTTLPARALTQGIPLSMLAAVVCASLALVTLASFFFRFALRRYASASS